MANMRAACTCAEQYIFTSESVTEGHPDKVCDYIADSILDSYLQQDPKSRVACEVLCKEGIVVIAGEITSNGQVDHAAVARQAIREIGYTDPAEPFNADGVQIHQFVSKQSSEIAQGVNTDTNLEHEQGAGDQGIMFGYATDESPELMPLPILLAHRLAKGLAEDRRNGTAPWLRPDGKTQVSVLYDNNRPIRVTDAIVSPQHSASISREAIIAYVNDSLAPRVLGEWYSKDIRFHVNPTGSFVLGGPSADAGVTGRKIIVDTYGGAGRHGGGAFSGKDPSKVDRSGAYFCRQIARQLIKQNYAKRAEIQISYAIGMAKPLSVRVDTFGTGDPNAAAEYVMSLDFRPARIIEQLQLLQPIYRQTTNYGHFGKPGLPWEK
ncbi:MAG: methionine adenosyltransferase [Acidobacteriota bacterium]|jgi:S-adenosylmethionine synthetase|nr:methionine adenosyltransferase [Acidobacteriota bacterium]